MINFLSAKLTKRKRNERPSNLYLKSLKKSFITWKNLITVSKIWRKLGAQKKKLLLKLKPKT